MTKQTEAEFYNALLDWCRVRLPRPAYRELLDRYRAEGPREINQDEPKIVASEGTD